MQHNEQAILSLAGQPAGAANLGVLPAAALDVVDWRQRVILGDAMAPALPAWLAPSYHTMRTHVMDPAYPCFFGTMAEKRGEMFYSFVEGGDLATLAASMATFARLSAQPSFDKHNIAVFFEPDPVPRAHQDYQHAFWDVLQYLHDHDAHPAAGQQVDPADPAWEFTYAALEMFVVCACPSFRARHSRNLGPGMVLLFQPRSVFVDKVTNRVIGVQARNEVRRRLLTWDEVPAHPDLGFYGDPGNLEWKQYFLPDQNVAAADLCPFLRRQAQTPDPK